MRAKVRLLYFKHSRGSLSTNVIREICSYFADLLLAQVTSSTLRFYNCHTCTWEPQVLLRTPILVDMSSTLVVLKDDRVLSSGGGMPSSYWNAAYLLGNDGAVEQLPDMLIGRRSHGVIQVRHIYVFGGSSLYLGSAVHKKSDMFQSDYCRNYTAKKCEKIDLKCHNRTWLSLPDMREVRRILNPCLFNGYVYICGSGSLLVEAFSPQTEHFLSFQLQHSPEFDCDLYVHNNLLVINSRSKFISRFEAGEAGQLAQHSQVNKQCLPPPPLPPFFWSSFQPVVDATKGLYYIPQFGKILCFNMETGLQVS